MLKPDEHAKTIDQSTDHNSDGTQVEHSQRQQLGLLLEYEYGADVAQQKAKGNNE